MKGIEFMLEGGKKKGKEGLLDKYRREKEEKAKKATLEASMDIIGKYWKSFEARITLL
jgi:hypothetical protein